MRLGQTSLIDFGSRFLSSAIGFLATMYIARELGAEPLGIYNVTIGLVSWAAIFARVGISEAVSKRVSEGEDQSQYALAGFAVILGLFILLSAVILIFQQRIDQYVGSPVTIYILVILSVTLLHGVISSLLTGLHLVHIDGILSTFKTGVRAIVQVSLVVIGFQTTSLFIGHAVGFIFAALIGGYFVVRELPPMKGPDKKHFHQLANFAKFSWVGSLRSQMFNYTDIIVLGLFVSSELIGVYAISWNISQFLILFSAALTSTLFPEMSSMSAKGDPQKVRPIVEQSLSFGGLFLIPGLFGGALLGERILRIYGPQFPKGSTILTILIVANLFMGYQTQLLNTLNAIDRPELGFKVNLLFVVTNVSLNLVLIDLYGWIGAAIATTVSVATSLIFAYHYVSKIIDFVVPSDEIAKQWIAAVLMASVVYGGIVFEEQYQVLNHNVATVLTLVAVGASVYFGVLLVISTEFKQTVDRNLPFDLPLL